MKNFIQLTHLDGTKYFVNIQNIIHISEREDGTLVAFNDGSAISFIEKADAIMALINA